MQQHRARSPPPQATTAYKKEDSAYTRCYCEENVWLLCQKWEAARGGDGAKLSVVFVSNDAKKARHRTRARAPDGPLAHRGDADPLLAHEGLEERDSVGAYAHG